MRSPATVFDAPSHLRVRSPDESEGQRPEPGGERHEERQKEDLYHAGDLHEPLPYNSARHLARQQYPDRKILIYRPFFPWSRPSLYSLFAPNRIEQVRIPAPSLVD